MTRNGKSKLNETVNLQLSMYSAQYIFASIYAETFKYNPTADLVISELRKSLENSEAGREVLSLFE